MQFCVLYFVDIRETIKKNTITKKFIYNVLVDNVH